MDEDDLEYIMHYKKNLVMFTKMYSDSHYQPQISLPFHQVFLQCI